MGGQCRRPPRVAVTGVTWRRGLHIDRICGKLQKTSQRAMSVTGTGKKMTSQISVFDGHNDVLLRLYKSTSSDVVSDFLDGEDAGHIDLKKARAGACVGGLFAIVS